MFLLEKCQFTTGDTGAVECADVESSFFNNKSILLFANQWTLNEESYDESVDNNSKIFRIPIDSRNVVNTFFEVSKG